MPRGSSRTAKKPVSGKEEGRHAMQASTVNLNAVIPLEAFRTVNAGLSRPEMELAISQAQTLFDELYVHLLLKQSMHAVDPVQRLKTMMLRLGSIGNENEFHRQMIATFVSVQDLHTNYLLPEPYRSAVAFLPFMVEEYYDAAGFPHYPVTRVMPQAIQRPFEPGVEITHWNGMPVVNAITLNAADHAGSNAAARHLQGLLTMTTRPLLQSLSPREDWVTLTFNHRSGVGEIRFPWMVFRPRPTPAAVPADDADAAGSSTLGVDVGLEKAHRARQLLFVPESANRETLAGAAPVDGRQISDVPTQNPTTFPNEIEFGIKRTSSGIFGFLRLRSFDIQDVQAYVTEIMRILGRLPGNGLILDVRSNPGGNILAGEHLLQLFTDKAIEPEPVQIRNTVGTGVLSRAELLSQWNRSIMLSVETGDMYSQPFPVSSRETTNAIGRKYFGPVALIIDAACYSTTDFFSAGFQDHQIGPVLGYDQTTGAGGANVWTHELFRQLWPDRKHQAFLPLPKGMSMRAAFRRSIRVGANAGIPVEDLGVSANFHHRRTQRDILENDADLYDEAGRILTTLA
ncbi:peptidase S41 [Sinorhizobium medicae]|nr:peptidase S41 [Sinorhizobium medicae]